MELILSRLKKLASLASVCVATPLLMVGAASAAHADSSVTWQTNTAFSGCLAYTTSAFGGLNVDNLNMRDCTNPGAWGYVNFYDVNEGSGQWLEKPGNFLSQCMTAYWDHSVYFETCKNNGTGNSYERWYENYTGAGWTLQNVATGEYLNCDSSGNVYTSQFPQLWH